ncbi:MAG: DUF357 domain-containing protein [Sulfolobales archaeon]|nr:cytidylyltransferase family protein [Sulfolobales archaeon]MCX8186374.1 cytidylyltransferase family protein [Sulfolobales archaeon]MDW7968891.1 DUF357 domain-containing protein [Sulfolobales archaeon]
MSTVDDGLSTRVYRYISIVDRALSRVRDEDLKAPEGKEILNLVKSYVSDSKHYFSLGDYITSLSCIAYAEGLLDALRLFKLVSFDWEYPKVRRVLVGGTFDIIHPGHIYYLSEASKFGLVYAVVARDSTVRRVKGREPVNDELSRLEVINSLKYVYRAFLGSEEDMLKSVESVKPDIILLGPDQPIDEGVLAKNALSRGFNVEVLRLPTKYKSDIASTSKIINKVLELYCK